MLLKLSDRIQRINVSQTIEMARLSNQLRNNGTDVIDLSLGQTDFETPLHIREAAKAAIEANFSGYTPPQGYPGLISAIVNKLKRENNLEYTAAEIMASNGAKHSIANVLQVLIDIGDEVILPAPYWVTYFDLIKLANGSPVVVQTKMDNYFKLTPQQLELAITPRTRLLVLCSPSNPTGSAYTYSELEKLAEVLIRFPDVFILSDEIYEHLYFEGKHASIAQFSSLKSRVIIVNGISKSYSMTGWRLGYMAAHKDIISQCVKLQGQYTSNPSSISQKAAEAALNGGTECIDPIRNILLNRRNTVSEQLALIPGIRFFPAQAAFYMFPDFSSYYGKLLNNTLINNSEDMSLYILRNAHVALVAGSAFGNDNCLRISLVTSVQKLTEACTRIAKVLYV